MKYRQEEGRGEVVAGDVGRGCGTQASVAPPLLYATAVWYRLTGPREVLCMGVVREWCGCLASECLVPRFAQRALRPPAHRYRPRHTTVRHRASPNPSPPSPSQPSTCAAPMNSALDPAKAPQFLDSMLRKNKIVIISATYCEFCTRIKMLLIELKHRFVSLEINIIPNGREVFTEVAGRTGIHTVPQVFLHGKYLGGYDDLVAMYRKGDLSAILEKK